MTPWYALLQHPCVCFSFVIIYWNLTVWVLAAPVPDLGRRAYICVDATERALPYGVPSLTTALVDCYILLLLPIWAQILAPCSPTVSQIAQPNGCTRGGQANCSAPTLPTACCSWWPEPACCHLVYPLRSYTCIIGPLDFSYKTSSRRKLLRISRWRVPALNQKLGPFWEQGSVWLHRSHAHEFSPAQNTDSGPLSISPLFYSESFFPSPFTLFVKYIATLDCGPVILWYKKKYIFGLHPIPVPGTELLKSLEFLNDMGKRNVFYYS